LPGRLRGLAVTTLDNLINPCFRGAAGSGGGRDTRARRGATFTRATRRTRPSTGTLFGSRAWNVFPWLEERLTGKKVEYLSIPYKAITHFSVETAGHFDLDAELKVWVSGASEPVSKILRGADNVTEIQKALATASPI
jgi:hypothetical protein